MKYACPMKCEGDETYPSPGDCPVCGMHLEQLLAFGAPQEREKGDDYREYRKLARRFVVGAVFSIPILALALAGFFPRRRRFYAASSPPASVS